MINQDSKPPDLPDTDDHPYGRHALQAVHTNPWDVFTILHRCHRASPWRDEGVTFRLGPVDYVGRHYEMRRTPPKFRAQELVAKLGEVA